MPEEKLKPCPFCEMPGIVQAWHTGEYNVCCSVCHVSAEEKSNRVEAVKAWNTRPADKLVPSDSEKIKKLVVALKNAIEGLKVLRPSSGVYVTPCDSAIQFAEKIIGEVEA